MVGVANKKWDLHVGVIWLCW